jgi:hypothetical protein
MEHQEFEVLRARRIEVVDAAGRPRIRLTVLPDGPGLTLMDAAGRGRIGLRKAAGKRLMLRRSRAQGG